MDLGLAGRTILITGAAGGVGRATALAFGREGARLVLAGRTASTLEEVARDAEALGAKAIAVPTDVTDDDSVKQLVARTREAYGRVDVLHPTTMARGTGMLEAQQMGGALAMRIGRPLVPEDVAKAILFFASDLAECVTGQELAVEGGQTAGVGY